MISVRVTGHVERFLLCFPFLALTKETNKKRQNPKEKSVTVLFALAKEPSPFTPLVCSSLIVVVLSVACSVFSFLFTPCVFPFEPSSEPSTRYVPFLLVFQSFPVFNTVLFTAEGCVGGGRSGVSPVVKGKDNRFLFLSLPSSRLASSFRPYVVLFASFQPEIISRHSPLELSLPICNQVDVLSNFLSFARATLMSSCHPRSEESSCTNLLRYTKEGGPGRHGDRLPKFSWNGMKGNGETRKGKKRKGRREKATGNTKCKG